MAVSVVEHVLDCIGMGYKKKSCQKACGYCFDFVELD